MIDAVNQRAVTELMNVYEFERRAAELLPAMVYDYYAGGAFDEIALKENHAAYDRIKLMYRVLVDVSERDTATRVLGHDVSMPVLVAPTAFQCMANDEGETATARASGAAGTIMVVSTLSNKAVEEIAAAASGPLWFQLYVYKDRAVSVDLIRRVEAAGCTAIVMTVDAPVWGCRERDVRNQFQLPSGLTAKNLFAAGMERFPDEGGSGLTAYIASVIDPTLNWNDIGWLRGVTSLPILIKGVVRGDDAARAVQEGADGVIVSNHGGRQLDSAPATIDALPEVVDAVGGRAEVLVDGGIRRGTDVVKALARGARAVLVGRPILWGLAVDGQRGVARTLEILRSELDLAMGLCGCRRIEDITDALL